MNTIRSIIKVAMILFISGVLVVTLFHLPGTESRFMTVNDADNALNISVTEITAEAEQAVIFEPTEAASGSNGKPAVEVEETQPSRGQATVDNSGPPDWAPEEARRGYEWSQSGKEGPPPWAPEEAHRGYERSQSDDGGPPTWAPAHARERYEWSQSGEEGPPPWAGKQ